MSSSGTSSVSNITLGFVKNAERFFAYARERHRIHVLKSSGVKPPWSDDPIFQEWRFCNVFREDDKTTAWFRENVRDYLAERPRDVLFSTMLFRWFNRIETGEKILRLLRKARWNPEELRTNLNTCFPLVTGAYIIKTPAGMKKLEGIIWCMEQAVPFLSMLARQMRDDASLQTAWKLIRSLPYLGNFMSYEIVTDLRHTCLLRDATDINLWASPGPGAAKGLGYLWDDPDKYNYNSAIHRECMNADMAHLLSLSRKLENWSPSWPRWEAREVEHTLCEYAKFVKARAGGKLKQRYRGGAACTASPRGT